MRHITIVLLGIATFISGCATQVNTDYETQHDFSNYQSYQWGSTKTDADAYIEFGGDIFDSRLQRAVSLALQSRSMTESTTPDFIVQYHLNTKERAYPNDDFRFGRFYVYGHPYYRRHFPYRYAGDFGPQRPTYVTVGTLTMQVKDATSQRVVWSSTAKTFLSENSSPIATEEKIKDLAFKMFSDFPPVTLPTP